MLAQLLEQIKTRIRTAIRWKARETDDPYAPFAAVGAPLKPRPPLNRSSIAVKPASAKEEPAGDAGGPRLSNGREF